MRLKKTRGHRLDQRFRNQVNRLARAGYPSEYLDSMAEKLHKKLLYSEKRNLKEKRETTIIVLP